MSRGLTTNQNTRLSEQVYRSEKLIEIITPGTNYFYTTGDISVTTLTDTSLGTQTFLADNGVELFLDLKELYEPGLSEVGIEIGDVDGTIYEDITRVNNNYDFGRSTMNVYLLFRDIATGTPYTSDIITLFKGDVYKVDLNRDDTNMTINVRAHNLFSNFIGTNGLTVADFSNGITIDNIVFGE